MMRKPRASALCSERDDTSEPDGNTEFLARRTGGDVGHDGHSWPRGPHHHHGIAPRSATRPARSGALDEFDIYNRHNGPRAGRAYSGGRAMGARVRSMWWARRFRRGLVLLGW